MSHSGFGLVISCEHASCDVPPELELGLTEAQLRSHLGWDPGASEVAATLAQRTGAPLLLGTVSRLVVDLNRRADAADVVPERSHGVAVPGNLGLGFEQRQARIERWHRPYRTRLASRVQAAISQQHRCLHLSIHSFTPTLGTQQRELDVGVLFDPARSAEVAWAQLLLAGLRGAGLDARANAPYLGIDDGCTTWLRTLHADPAYAGLEIELSQALAADRAVSLCAVLVGLLRHA